MSLKISTLAVLAAVSLGTGCSETTTSKNEGSDDAKKAELISLASATGALQFCRATGLLSTDTPEGAFYRLAAILRPLAEKGDGDDREFVMTAELAYQQSAKLGRYQPVIFKDGAVTIPAPTPMKVTEQCKAVEATLKAAMAKGRLLDVIPAKPLAPPGTPT